MSKSNIDPATIGDVKQEVGCLAVFMGLFVIIFAVFVSLEFQKSSSRIKALETQLQDRK